MGGAGAEIGTSAAVDAAGNVYLGGTTDSAKGVITRMDAAGTNITATAALAGATVAAIALDSGNGVVVVGRIAGTGFSGPTAGAVAQPAATGYVSKLTPDLKMSFTATLTMTPSAVALDSSGAIYIIGSEATVVKLSADGARVLYSTVLGGSDRDSGRAIAVNAAGEAYAAGDTASADFRITPGAFQTRFSGRVAGYGDSFVAKLDASGANLIFSTYMGGAQPDVAMAIALDREGNAYVAGGTQSPDFPVTATTYAGGTLPSDAADPAGDAFVAKFSPAGARVWSRFLGGASREMAAAVALDASGGVYVAGSSESADFPWTAGAVRRCRDGGPFAAQLDASDARLLQTSSIAGMGFDQANALALDGKGGVYLGGSTTSRPFFSTAQAVQRSYGGGDSDAFAAKLDWTAAPRPMIACVLHAASFAAGNFAFYPQGTVAPGEIVSIFGPALGPDEGVSAEPANGLYPASLAGSQVLFDGIGAPVFYVGPNQINAVVPYGIQGPVTQLALRRGGVTDGPHLLPVEATVPGIFSANGSGQGQAAVLNQDGSFNSTSNPAARGDVIVLYAAGAGTMIPPQQDGAVQATSLPLPAPSANVTAQIRGEAAEVVYAGAAPGYIAGLLQVNLRVPATIPAGNSVPLTLSVGGQSSQANITIAVK